MRAARASTYSTHPVPRVEAGYAKLTVRDSLQPATPPQEGPSRLKELGAAAKVMGPKQDWRFLNSLSSKVRARHKPVRDKSNLKMSDELLDLGLSLIDKTTEAQGLRAAILHRDG